jgi:hypothetical protein
MRKKARFFTAFWVFTISFFTALFYSAVKTRFFAASLTRRNFMAFGFVYIIIIITFHFS